MAYYANWYKQTVNSGSESTATSTSTISLLTPAQVTVSSVRDRLVYNIEYKQSTEKIENKPTPERRPREKTFSASSDTFAAANAVAARFHQNHTRNHTRRHSRKSSSESNLSNLSIMTDISEESMWDDWLVKYLDKKNVAVDDAKIEDWIFETTM